MHVLTSVIAVIELSFVPIVTIGDWNIRLETIGLALAVFACLVLAVQIGRRTPVDATRPPDARGTGTDEDEPNHLRGDDLLYIAVASLPGAVAGGRLGYGLLHLDFYGANPSALFDATQGSFQLSMAVVGGTLTAMIVAGLLGAPIGRWMHALILPLLLGLAAGKATMMLGGDGQGLPFDGAWATAYVGPGPWGSLGPAIPSHPSQAYEALATGAVLLAMMGLLSMGWFGRRDGRAFLAGLALWAVARALVAATWRDPAALGPLNADQVISIGITLGALILLAGVAVVGRVRRASPSGTARPGAPGGRPEMDWPDPATRPRI